MAFQVGDFVELPREITTRAGEVFKEKTILEVVDFENHTFEHSAPDQMLTLKDDGGRKLVVWAYGLIKV